MAVYYDPIVKVNLTGTSITAYALEETFVLSTKLEETHSINAVSGNKTIDLSNIANNKVLMFSSDSAFIIHLTKSVTSPLLETFDYTFDIPNVGGVPTILNINQAFITGLESISISTTSTNLININVNAYGETTTA